MSRDARDPGQVDHVLVAGNLLIVTGWTGLGDTGRLEPRLIAGGQEVELAGAEVIRTGRASPSAAAGHGFVIFLDLEQEIRGRELTLALASGEHEQRLECPAPSGKGLAAFVQELLTGRVEERDKIRAAVERRIEPLAREGAGLPRPDQLDPAIPAHVDRACLIPGKGVFLYGWILDPGSDLRAVHLVTPGQLGPNLLQVGARYHRPDLEPLFPEAANAAVPPGLLAFVEADVDEDLTSAELLFVTHGGDAASIAFRVEDPRGGAFQQLELMLATIHPDDVDVARLLDSHIGPAIEARWEARRPAAPEVEEHAFGTPPVDPPCSIIVPLYGRHDFLMYQMSRFGRDPELTGMDLIYVIDDERIREATLRLAREIAPLWPNPFRVLDLGGNFGFAGANNAAARVARGELLLLLNSDVLPDRAGWVGRLCDRHRSIPGCGAVAPRLLFEDGSIQHDGIAFVRHPRVPSIWINDHPGKGLPPSLAASPEDAQVPAVTGACMLVRRDVYTELGGLDEGYVIGDFEDSDLCLKLRERGLTSHVIRSESLFHLERLSGVHVEHPDWRPKVTLYNAWRHTRRWGKILEEAHGDAS